MGDEAKDELDRLLAEWADRCCSEPWWCADGKPERVWPPVEDPVEEYKLLCRDCGWLPEDFQQLLAHKHDGHCPGLYRDEPNLGTIVGSALRVLAREEP